MKGSIGGFIFGLVVGFTLSMTVGYLAFAGGLKNGDVVEFATVHPDVVALVEGCKLTYIASAMTVGGEMAMILIEGCVNIPAEQLPAVDVVPMLVLKKATTK